MTLGGDDYWVGDIIKKHLQCNLVRRTTILNYYQGSHKVVILGNFVKNYKILNLPQVKSTHMMILFKAISLEAGIPF